MKMKSTDVLKKVLLNIEEDKFVNATKLLKSVVNGKVKSKIETAKKRIYPEQK